MERSLEVWGARGHGVRFAAAVDPTDAVVIAEG